MTSRLAELRKRGRLSNYYSSGGEYSSSDEEDDEQERRLSKRFGEASEAPIPGQKKKNEEEKKDDDEEQQKAPRPKRPKLEISNIISEKGLIKIKNEFPSIKYKSTNTSIPNKNNKKKFKAEVQAAKKYSQSLLDSYKTFSINLFPHLGFEDLLSKIDTLSSKAELKSYINIMRSATRNEYLENIYGKEKMERMVYEFEHGRIKPTNDTISSPVGAKENRPSIGEGGDDEDVEAEFNDHQENDATPPSQRIVHDDENRGRRRIEEDDEEEETEMTFDDNDGDNNVPKQNDSPGHSSEQIVNDEPMNLTATTEEEMEMTFDDDGDNNETAQSDSLNHSSQQLVNDEPMTAKTAVEDVETAFEDVNETHGNSPEHSSEQIVNDDPTPKSEETTLEDENSAPTHRDTLAQTENIDSPEEEDETCRNPKDDNSSQQIVYEAESQDNAQQRNYSSEEMVVDTITQQQTTQISSSESPEDGTFNSPLESNTQDEINDSKEKNENSVSMSSQTQEESKNDVDNSSEDMVVDEQTPEDETFSAPVESNTQDEHLVKDDKETSGKDQSKDTEYDNSQQLINDEVASAKVATQDSSTQKDSSEDTSVDTITQK